MATEATNMFMVYHTFKEGKADEWWAGISKMMTEDNGAGFKAMTDKQKDLGFINHYFMPEGGASPACCLWETKSSMEVEEFQKFIDGPDGPGDGALSNKSFKVMPGGMIPAKKFAGAADEEAKPSTGCFYWVYHTFKDGKAGAFWEYVQALDMGAFSAKCNSLGFHNHVFAPCDPAGPCICIWECSKDIGPEEFQKFIDGPDGPGGGEYFVNECHKVAPGGFLPSAKFVAA